MNPIHKERLYIVVIIFLIALCGQFYYSYHYTPSHTISVSYNKDEDLSSQITHTIRNADKFVYFAIYTFTKQDMKDALLGAKYRGLTVIGITDKNQYQGIEIQRKIIDELRNAGIPIYEQDHSAIMHIKAVVTEKAYASGSYNWTASATNANDEVLEVGTDENVRSQYEKIMLEIFRRYKK